jgi:hypothetical protein
MLGFDNNRQMIKDICATTGFLNENVFEIVFDEKKTTTLFFFLEFYSALCNITAVGDVLLLYINVHGSYTESLGYQQFRTTPSGSTFTKEDLTNRTGKADWRGSVGSFKLVTVVLARRGSGGLVPAVLCTSTQRSL